MRHEYLVNLSMTGLCLHMQAPVSVGEELSIAFRLPSDEALVQAVCKVVWTSHAGEIHPFPRFFETGLYLVELDASDRRRIELFVEEQVDRP
jgi:hypothetical protein